MKVLCGVIKIVRPNVHQRHCSATIGVIVYRKFEMINRIRAYHIDTIGFSPSNLRLKCVISIRAIFD